MKTIGRAVLAALAMGWIAFSLRAGEKATTDNDAAPAVDLKSAAGKIDQFIAEGLQKNNLSPNPPIDDATFLRRVSLDIIGRIPTLRETVDFLESKDTDKRSRLIDRLLDSEGYVSHQFNYWADLLRVQSQMANVPAEYYIDWIKQSLRENKPYDQFVRELITAEGYVWDNGAAGYYLRDAGMPLDHMANTARVFLGTQLVCAQCHNHPYDSWTQLQYYEQAAFAYGVRTSDSGINRQLRALNNSKELDVSPQVKVTARQLVRPLRMRVNERPAKLQLPPDYRYDDAKPKSVVHPAVIFGPEVNVGKDDSPRAAYAGWMTSPENPRFTVTIANRLWKRVMGVGLIEPVDDLGDNFEASNPELMNYLTRLMIDLNYDLRRYQEILYNTQTYQRAVTEHDLEPGAPCYFPGPVLERMSAEQIWDSLMTLIVPDIDERPGTLRRNDRYEIAKFLSGKDLEEIVAVAERQTELANKAKEYRNRSGKLRNQIQSAQKANEKEKAASLRQQLKELREKYIAERDAIRESLPLGDGARTDDAKTDAADPRWKGYPNQFVRASELPSPAPPGHFLRQFGQSDRETIDNAYQDATVPQILTLLNGPVFEAITKPNSVLVQNVKQAKTDEEKLNVIFLSTLNRYPTPQESQDLLPPIQNRGLQACADVLWAVLNTRQFMFVQ